MPPPSSDMTLMLHLPPKMADATRRTIHKLGHRAAVIRRPDDADRLIKKHGVELFVFNIKNPSRDCELFNRIKKSNPNCKGIAFLSPKLKGNFPMFRSDAYPDHLIPDKASTELSDLEITLGKIIGGRIFGMEKYGVKVHEKVSLSSSLQKLEILQGMRKFFLKKKVNPRILQRATLILDEMIMNAIFDAPTDAHGRRLHYDKDRDSSISLKKKQRPQISYGYKEGALAVSVTDPFGSFEKQTFFSVLNRMRSERSIRGGGGKGAGMGLFMTFRAVDELVVNVEPGRRTEFIALLQLKSNRKQRGLHFFQNHFPRRQRRNKEQSHGE